jgi:uncharacterized protein YoaH (UPF0181 family)
MKKKEFIKELESQGLSNTQAVKLINDIITYGSKEKLSNAETIYNNYGLGGLKKWVCNLTNSYN